MPIPVALTGGDGNDTYSFQDGFGSVTVIEAPDGGSDTLDFTALTGTITHPTDTTFVSSAGGTVTLSGTAPEHIDVKLADAGSFRSGIKNAFDKITGLVEQVSASPELAAPLPLLDPSSGSSVAGLLGLGSSFGELAS
jgi:hypothetical protein